MKPRITVNPDEAVSLGAAVLAGTLDGTLSNMQVMSTWKAALYRAFYENYNQNAPAIEEKSTDLATTTSTKLEPPDQGDDTKPGPSKEGRPRSRGVLGRLGRKKPT